MAHAYIENLFDIFFEFQINMDGTQRSGFFPLSEFINFFLTPLGTALYEAVAALFIAQLRDIHLTLGHIVAVR